MNLGLSYLFPVSEMSMSELKLNLKDAFSFFFWVVQLDIYGEFANSFPFCHRDDLEYHTLYHILSLQCHVE